MLKEQQDIKKPLPCNQSWNEMVPTDGGRICLGCGKLVSDFRTSTWSEIARIHSSSPIPVCGVYSEKQINSWGQNFSNGPTSCSKLVTLSAALLAISQLSPLSVKAQTATTQEQSIKQTFKNNPAKEKPKQKFVSGTIVALQPDSTKLPLRGVSVFILQDSLHFSTVTDSAGRFVFDITNRFSRLPNTISLILTHSDFATKTIPINKNKLKVLDVTFSQVLIEGKKVPLIDRGQAFYVLEMPETKTKALPQKKWWQFWKKN